MAKEWTGYVLFSFLRFPEITASVSLARLKSISDRAQHALGELVLEFVAASAARIFGWDRNNKPGVQLNQLVITTEQLQEIRALQEQADAQECPSDTPGRP